MWAKYSDANYEKCKPVKVVTTYYTTLIDTAALAHLCDLTDPQQSAEINSAIKLVVLDCRFSLTQPEAGQQSYNDAHIPGAHYAHLESNLSAPIITGKTGRHPLPHAEHFVSCLSQWGVDHDTQIVVYDDAGGAIAARAWWLCQWIGHANCAVLNGGFKAWTTEDLPLSQTSTISKAGNIKMGTSLTTVVDAGQLMDASWAVFDARAAERFTGQTEPLDRVAGHIPGAINLPFTDNLTEHGTFASKDALAARFRAACGSESNKVVHYCGSGVTAAHNILAMQHAGLGMTALYAGSWSEWIQDPLRPVTTSQ